MILGSSRWLNSIAARFLRHTGSCDLAAPAVGQAILVFLYCISKLCSMLVILGSLNLNFVVFGCDVFGPGSFIPNFRPQSPMFTMALCVALPALVGVMTPSRYASSIHKVSVMDHPFIKFHRV